MSKFPRMRTLFQSLDTARYHAKAKDKTPSVSKDTALARAEVLGALLFGHQIVIPAGAIADCPAFKELLAEVVDGAAEYREEIDAMLGEHYSPFVVGLEPRFEKEGNHRRTGYDHFVDDYLGDYGPDKVPTALIGFLSEKGEERTQQEDLLLVGNGFLKQDFDAVAAVSESYAEHSRLVLQEFSDRSGPQAGKVYAATNFISEMDPKAYLTAIEQSVAAAEETKKDENRKHRIDYRGLSDLTRLGQACFTKIVDGQYPKSVNQRGAWYFHQDSFEQHWPVIRTWLDLHLNTQFMGGYEIALPSYFTQSLSLDKEISRLALVHMDPNQADGLDQPDRPTELPVSPDIVEWKTVWELLAKPAIQDSIRTLQNELCEIYFLDRKDGPYQLKMRTMTDPQEKYALEARHKERIRRARAAIDAHLEEITKVESGLVVQRTKQGLVLKVTKRASADKVKSTATKVMVGGGLLADATAAMYIGSDPTKLTSTLFAAFATKLVLKIPNEAIEKVADWTTRRLYGTSAFDNDIGKKFGLSEVDRVSYWSVPNFVGSHGPTIVETS